MFYSFRGYDEPNKLASSQHMGLHSSVGGALQRLKAEATVRILLKPWKHFLGLICDCLNPNYNCDDHIFTSLIIIVFYSDLATDKNSENLIRNFKSNVTG